MSFSVSPFLRTRDFTVTALVPSLQLLDQSVQIGSITPRFVDWSKKMHIDSYMFMQRIAQAWKHAGKTDQYMIYGSIDRFVFKWEMIPYQRCETCIGRAFQQLVVLWRTVFGGYPLTQDDILKQTRKYETMLAEAPEITEPSCEYIVSNDVFCQQAVIDRQWVITGKKVNVLFNHAPIGFGGERLHFLVVPKAHREAFVEVTEEEYYEAMELTGEIADHFMTSRQEVKNVYILNKTGRDTGQTVKHWHLHVIFSTSNVQDFWGKFTVAKNILFGSSPMDEEDFIAQVTTLRQELAVLKAK